MMTRTEALTRAADLMAYANDVLRLELLAAQAYADGIADQDGLQAAIAWARYAGAEAAHTEMVGKARAMRDMADDLRDPEGLAAEAGAYRGI